MTTDPNIWVGQRGKIRAPHFIEKGQCGTVLTECRCPAPAGEQKMVVVQPCSQLQCRRCGGK